MKLNFYHSEIISILEYWQARPNFFSPVLRVEFLKVKNYGFMQDIINDYVLVRINIRSQESTVLIQSDDRSELQHLKGLLESKISIGSFHQFRYVIKQRLEVLSIN